MTAHDVYPRVATKITQQMNREKQAYATMSRLELATLLRQEAGQSRLRIGRNVADEIEAALDRQGFRVFPHISETGQNAAVRIIRRGTVFEKILNAFLHPDSTTDQQLADLLVKVKRTDLTSASVAG